MDRLPAEGFDPHAPAFFSWLGVSQYLTETSIFETLRLVASAIPGSEIVFEYALQESLLDEVNRRMLAEFKANSAARGEPWLISNSSCA